jgi:hypothetical protein
MKGNVNPAKNLIGNDNKKFWKELIADLPLIRHGVHRKRKKEGYTFTHRQQGDFINLLTKLRVVHRETRQQGDLISPKIMGHKQMDRHRRIHKHRQTAK